MGMLHMYWNAFNEIAAASASRMCLQPSAPAPSYQSPPSVQTLIRLYHYSIGHGLIIHQVVIIDLCTCTQASSRTA